MINGTLAAILFFVWAWVGYRLDGLLKSDMNPWSEWYSGSYYDPMTFPRFCFGGAWITSLVVQGASAASMISTCGTFGSFLLGWATVSTVVAMFILGCILVMGVLFFLCIVLPVMLWDKIPEKTRQNIHTGVWRPVGAIVDPVFVEENTGLRKGLLFTSMAAVVIFCGYIGSLPNPLCAADYKNPAVLEADLAKADIRSALSENNPELVVAFNKLIGEEEAESE